MRKINAISTKKHLVVTTGTNLFLTVLNIKITNKTGLQVCEAISLQTMCIKFYLSVGKLFFCGCQEFLDCIQNMGLK